MVTRYILESLGKLGSIQLKVIFNDHYNLHKLSQGKGDPDNYSLGYAAKLEKGRDFQKFSKLLTYLKNKGLVINPRKGIWALTSKGKDYLKKINRKDVVRGKKPYIPGKQLGKDDFKVIVFDIPEREKRKRDLLRASLANLEFRMLQRSVWTGDSKLPAEFIIFLDELNISPYLRIFIGREKSTTEFL